MLLSLHMYLDLHYNKPSSPRSDLLTLTLGLCLVFDFQYSQFIQDDQPHGHAGGSHDDYHGHIGPHGNPGVHGFPDQQDQIDHDLDPKGKGNDIDQGQVGGAEPEPDGNLPTHTEHQRQWPTEGQGQPTHHQGQGQVNTGGEGQSGNEGHGHGHGHGRGHGHGGGHSHGGRHDPVVSA